LGQTGKVSASGQASGYVLAEKGDVMTDKIRVWINGIELLDVTHCEYSLEGVDVKEPEEYLDFEPIELVAETHFRFLTKSAPRLCAWIHTKDWRNYTLD
jgi:hypothetical protein